MNNNRKHRTPHTQLQTPNQQPNPPILDRGRGPHLHVPPSLREPDSLNLMIMTTRSPTKMRKRVSPPSTLRVRKGHSEGLWEMLALWSERHKLLI